MIVVNWVVILLEAISGEPIGGSINFIREHFVTTQLSELLKPKYDHNEHKNKDKDKCSSSCLWEYCQIIIDNNYLNG